MTAVPVTDIVNDCQKYVLTVNVINNAIFGVTVARIDSLVSPEQRCEDTTIADFRSSQDGRKIHSIYNIVSSCPTTAARNISNACTREYDEDTIMDILHNPPVTSVTNSVAYRNKYCAFCNSEKILLDWAVSADCEEFGDFRLISSKEDIIESLISKRCHVYFEPDIIPVKACVNDSMHDFGTCSLSEQYRNDSNMLRYEQACLSDYAMPHHGNRNIFCTMCKIFDNSGHESSLIATCPDDFQGNATYIELCQHSNTSVLTYPYKNVFCYICHNLYSSIYRTLSGQGRYMFDDSNVTITETLKNNHYVYNLTNFTFNPFAYLKTVSSGLRPLSLNQTTMLQSRNTHNDPWLGITHISASESLTENPDLDGVTAPENEAEISNNDMNSEHYWIANQVYQLGVRDKTGRQIDINNLLTLAYSYQPEWFCNPEIIPEKFSLSNWFNIKLSRSCYFSCIFKNNEEIQTCATDLLLTFPVECIKSGDEKYLPVVDKCYELFADPIVKTRCEMANKNDIFNNIPVQNLFGTVYKSFDCYICNNFFEIQGAGADHFIEEMRTREVYQYTTLDVQLTCDKPILFRLMRNSYDILEYANQIGCQKRLKDNKFGQIGKACAAESTFGLINRCNTTGHWTEYDHNVIWACEQLPDNLLPHYTEYVTMGLTFPRTFKNIFCAACNPFQYLSFQMKKNIIDTCSKDYDQVFQNMNIREACIFFPMTLNQYPYKNMFCRMCNNISYFEKVAKDVLDLNLQLVHFDRNEPMDKNVKEQLPTTQVENETIIQQIPDKIIFALNAELPETEKDAACIRLKDEVRSYIKKNTQDYHTLFQIQTGNIVLYTLAIFYIPRAGVEDNIKSRQLISDHIILPIGLDNLRI